jgi:hypothetical protein
MTQTPKPEPAARITRAYGRRPRTRPNSHLMVCLRPDALEAVIAVMTTHGLTKSGAVHHLVRLGAGLTPFI